MRKAKYLWTVLAAVLCLILWQCCHHKHHDPKPDPCAGKTATGANFNIYENFEYSSPLAYTPFGWIKYPTDTVYMQTLDLVALDTDGISYEWVIGDTTYTTKSVTLDFSTRPNGQNSIPITLTVHKQHTNSCFPADTGTMTFTKLIYFSDSSLVSGYFKGVKTDTLGNSPSDSITVYVNPFYNYSSVFGVDGNYDSIGTRVENLFPSCGNKFPYEYISGQSNIAYKEVAFTPDGNHCYGTSGRALLGPSNNDITIRYGYVNPSTHKSEEYLFRGKRTSKPSNYSITIEQ